VTTSRPLVIRGGHLIDPSQKIDRIGDLVIEEGAISAIDPPAGQLPLGEPTILDASGLVVTPGFVDIHTHLRVPGFEYKENLITGTRAAAAGGFTTICAMPNTNPVIDSRSVVESVLEQASKQAIVNVYVHGAISIGQEGKQLAELGDLSDAGAIGFTDDGIPLANSKLMRHALEYATQLGRPVSNHAEDPALIAGAAMHEGVISTRLGLPAAPRQAEEIMLSRDLLLAELTAGRYHCIHVSSGGSVDLIKRAKDRGVSVTAEVTPHHLTLTDELVAGRSEPVSAALPPYDTRTKVAPPLRERADCETLIKALVDGTIDCIATDHAPHALHDKDVEFADAAVGFSTLETTLASILTLVRKNQLKLTTAIERLTVGPAQCYGLPAGTLKLGSPADVTIFDPDEEFIVDPASFQSRGRNTPLAGLPLHGVVHHTFVNGAHVYDRSSPNAGALGG
jgi:dihydroorotase